MIARIIFEHGWRVHLLVVALVAPVGILLGLLVYQLEQRVRGKQ